MGDINFASKEHRDFFYAALAKCGCMDVYHEALFYALGIAHETRVNIDQLYNFHNRCINLEGLHAGWQTGGTSRLTRLAFNLFNGFIEEGEEGLYTPYALFDCSFASYFMEAVKLRFPEYCLSELI